MVKRVWGAGSLCKAMELFYARYPNIILRGCAFPGDDFGRRASFTLRRHGGHGEPMLRLTIRQYVSEYSQRECLCDDYCIH